MFVFPFRPHLYITQISAPLWIDAASAYAAACPKPNGNTLVLQFSQNFTDTQGFIARDDNKKEIVVSLRGRCVKNHKKNFSMLKLNESRSESFTDALTDINILPAPFVSPGVKAPCTYPIILVQGLVDRLFHFIFY